MPTICFQGITKIRFQDTAGKPHRNSIQQDVQKKVKSQLREEHGKYARVLPGGRDVEGYEFFTLLTNDRSGDHARQYDNNNATLHQTYLKAMEAAPKTVYIRFAPYWGINISKVGYALLNLVLSPFGKHLNDPDVARDIATKDLHNQEEKEKHRWIKAGAIAKKIVNVEVTPTQHQIKMG